MSHWLRSFAVALPLLAGCGVLPDVTIGANEGVPPVAGSTTIAIPQNFQCGTPITDPEGKYTVTTSGTADACTFTFSQDVLVIAASDYSSRPELKGAQLIRRVDFVVSELAITDGAGAPLSLDALISLDGKAFDTTIFTEADLTLSPPFTKSVTGAPVDALKAQVKAQQDVVAPVDVEVVVSLASAPAQIGLSFEAQPEIVLGF